MAKIKGKQIDNSTIDQRNMNIVTDSIVNLNHTTNKEFAETVIYSGISNISYSTSDLNITTNVTSGISVACNQRVTDIPYGGISIFLNGIKIDDSMYYFSPDGLIVRDFGLEQKGDYLYWNSLAYDLDSSDRIDFHYLTVNNYLTLNSGDIVTISPFYNSIVVRYIGDTGTTMTIIAENTNIVVGNVGGNFVWDIGGLNEHTFTIIDESYGVIINGIVYTIWFNGFGSLIYSLINTQYYFNTVTGLTLGYIQGSTNTFTINTNTNSSWSITENIDWLSLSSYSGVGDATITATTLSGTTYVEKTGIITIDIVFGNVQYSVNIQMIQNYFNINKTGLTFSYSSGLTDTFTFNTNASWTISESLDWFNVNNYSGIGTITLTVTTVSVNTFSIRTGIISIIIDGVSTNLVISQGYFNVSSTGLTFKYLSGLINLLTINTNLSWVISESIDWLQFNTYSGIGTTTVTGTTIISNTGTTIKSGYTSIVVSGVTTNLLISQNTPPPQPPPQISAGNSLSIEMDSLGQAWGWGVNYNGNLGDNTNTHRSIPVAVCGNHTFTQISVNTHSLAIDNLGMTWSWGYNEFGKLGDNTIVQKSTPVAVCGNHTFTDISAGQYHSMGIDNLGQAWGWGQNTWGQLGDNTLISKRIPVVVCGNHTFTKISAGGGYSLAIDNLGMTWAWGYNSEGQLGDNTNNFYSTPVAVFGNKTFIAISAGANFSLGIDNLGKAWGWGWNYNGQLGDNTIVQKSTPVAVFGNKTFITISAGANFSLGIDNLGKAWGWGYNNQGQLGDNTLISKRIPVAVYGNHTFISISAGSNHSLGIDNLGMSWGWGYNTFGQLGDNTVVSQRTPIRVCNL